MADEKFDLVFSGALAKGVALAAAKHNLQKLFKMPEGKVDALFSGRAVVLKKGLDLDTANKYRVAIKKAGALVELREVVPVAAKPARPAVQGKAVFAIDNGDESSDAAVEQKTKTIETIDYSRAALPTSESEEPERLPEPRGGVGLTLAPVGADVLAVSERSYEPDIDVDLGEYSLREGGDLLDRSERTPEPLPLPVPDLDVAPPGADILNDEQRAHEQAPQLDLSQFGIAEVGVRLQEPNVDTATVPDTSHLSVADT